MRSRTEEDPRSTSSSAQSVERFDRETSTEVFFLSFRLFIVIP